MKEIHWEQISEDRHIGLIDETKRLVLTPTTKDDGESIWHLSIEEEGRPNKDVDLQVNSLEWAKELARHIR
jgi:hypothetical protein